MTTQQRPTSVDAFPVIRRMPSRPDGVFVRPGSSRSIYRHQRRPARRPGRGNQLRSAVIARLARAAWYFRQPDPLVEIPRPGYQLVGDSAAARAAWMRRRDDPNP